MFTKICTRCNQEKRLESFYRANQRPTSRCKECLRQIQKDKRKVLKKPCAPPQNTKTCSKCLLSLPITNFRKYRWSKSGYYCWCKSCVRTDHQRRNERNKSEPKVEIEGKICSVCKTYQKSSNYYKNRIYKDGLGKLCKDCTRTEQQNRQRAISALHKDIPTGKVCPNCKEYKLEHHYGKCRMYKDGLNFICKECARAQQRKNQPQKTQKEREKLANDPIFRLIHNLRGRVHAAVKNRTKSGHTKELLGCTGEECMNHLEKLFWPGMTRENMNKDGWVIDHIVPINSFDKTDPEWQFKAFHYTNTQPLWYEDNLNKSDRLDWTPQESKHELPERLKTSLPF